MSDDDDTARVSVDVDSEIYELAKKQLDHGELSETVRDVISTLAHGAGWDRTDVLDRQIAEREATLEDLRETRRQANASIESVENELRQLRNKRENVDTRADEFRGALLNLERRHREGRPPYLHEEHSDVLELSRRYGEEPKEIMDQLKERNPDLPDVAFEEYSPNQRETWHGLDEDHAAIPVEEREERDITGYLA